MGAMIIHHHAPRKPLGGSRNISAIETGIPMSARYGTIESTPTGAALWLDGRRLSGATTPHTLWVRLGQHIVEARLPGYRPDRRSLTVVSGPPLTLALTLEKRHELRGMLRVTSHSIGSRVLIDGRSIGITPLPPVSLAPRRYRLELRPPKGPAQVQWVEILPGKTTVVTLAAPTVRPRQRRMTPMRLAAWISLGLGGALLATGLGLHLDGWRINKNADNWVRALNGSQQLTEQRYREYSARFDKSHDRLRMAVGFYSAGAALVLTSVVLFIVESQRGSARERLGHFRLSPEVSGNRLSLYGRMVF